MHGTILKHIILSGNLWMKSDKSWSDKGKQPWVYCRLAEIYLNYAEAMYHCGKEDVAREYVNYIRKKSTWRQRGYFCLMLLKSGEALFS